MPSAPEPIKFTTRYGIDWSVGTSPLFQELYCIRKGGEWLTKKGRTVGAGLFEHYRNLQSLLWPDYEHHRWSDLALRTILENRLTVLQGPKDSGKTNSCARFALADYICFPQETLILVSSTDIESLQMRVWGEIKDLFGRARERFPDDIPGNLLESFSGIFTDDLTEDGRPRDWRKGITCVPMKDQSGRWMSGLAKFAGRKQKRRRWIADECQFANADGFVSVLANLDKGDFKGVFIGNPLGEGDPLDQLAEPAEGWDSQPDFDVTTTWKTRSGGVAVNFVGLDSPAIAEPEKYPFLLNQQDIDRIIGYWGKDSAQYWNQAKGVRPPGVSERRVVTRDMAQKFGALNEVIWRGTATTRLYAIDAGYGGDRCIGGDAAFGLDVNGKVVLSLGLPRVIPVRFFSKATPEADRQSPEDQIAEFVKADCERLGIPSGHVFHDATGRGSLGSAFARLWRHDTNPVEFGGSPTPRPVMDDLYIYDEKLKKKRLKRCDEHYSKRVSELHFSVRYVIEASQMRNLTHDVLDELARREWKRVRGDRIEVESKDDYKERYGRSCDIADWAAICVEGARRLGFRIARLDSGLAARDDDNEGWKDILRARARKMRQSHALNYSV